MAYCAKADILGQISEYQLIELTDDNKTGAENDTIITQAIADSDSEIDGWVGKRYTVPLSPVPAIVKKLSIDIAIYNLYARRRGLPEDRKERYSNAITFLKAVSKGDATLGEDDPSGVPQSQTVDIESNTRVFSHSNLEGF